MKKIRPIRVDGDIAYVTLTKGYEAVIDADDVSLISGYNWTALVAPHTVYAYRAEHHGPDKIRRTVYMHRAIVGDPSGMEVDHRDCEGTNNRRSNLRVCTRAENACNRKAQKNNASGIKGVSWSEKSKAWVAFISSNYTNRYLGRFDNPEDAKRAYAAYGDLLHGEFSRHH